MLLVGGSIRAIPVTIMILSRNNFFCPFIPLVFTTLALWGFMGIWLQKVNSFIPEPYLDEVFHVRQALAYWKHRWLEWDPKITTPPGLYLVSYLAGTFFCSIFRCSSRLSAPDMRYTNGLVLFNLLPITLRKVLKKLWQIEAPEQATGVASCKTGICEWQLNLTALNICMFPPLFFFSGLYYTDLAALLIVLHVYGHDLQRQCDAANAGPGPTFRNIFSRETSLVVMLGLLALLFRQTNIFWVAVFLGGLQVIRTLKNFNAECKATEMATIARSSWELRQIYDPPISEAYFEGK